MENDDKDHRPFSLVLAAGGARGFAHLGVLRALEEEGLRPDAIVGVSMGAVVGVTYGLREDWYSALLTMDTSQFPDPFYVRNEGDDTFWSWLNRTRSLTEFVWDCTFGWGIGDKMPSSGMKILKNLTRERNLEETTPPVVVCSTDLQSGSRVVHRTGSAPEAVFASASMAGVFPPVHRDDKILVDGGYADIAPVDVARDFDPPVVIAVDPTQSLAPKNIHNGFQAILRAAEICQMRHADLRFDEADFLLKPPFKRTIDSLDFNARRECVAAGIQAVRTNRKELRELLKT